MTIAALISHFGASVPRYVTVKGQIVFNNVSASAGGGYSHPVHGSVTPVQKHTFHAGTEASDTVGTAHVSWWDDVDSINRHVEAMSKAFPTFTYMKPEDSSAPAWAGQIDTGRGKFMISITMRSDGGLPRVAMNSKIRLGAPAGRAWIRSPHLYDSGNLCVADESDWNPVEHTAATATAWAAHWLAAFTEWRISRKWPVSGADEVAV